MTRPSLRSRSESWRTLAHSPLSTASCVPARWPPQSDVLRPSPILAVPHPDDGPRLREPVDRVIFHRKLCPPRRPDGALSRSDSIRRHRPWPLDDIALNPRSACSLDCWLLAIFPYRLGLADTYPGSDSLYRRNCDRRPNTQRDKRTQPAAHAHRRIVRKAYPRKERSSKGYGRGT